MFFRLLKIVLAIVVLGGIGFWLWNYAINQPVQNNYLTTYLPKGSQYYEDPSRPLDNIALKIVYAVPQDSQPALPENWLVLLDKLAGELTSFHQLQFVNASRLTVDILPEPYLLAHESIFYDTENTNYGNPSALTSISAELKDNLETWLYSQQDGRHTSLAIIYEGVGSSGMDGAMLFSRDYLTKQEYAYNRSARFYHEFAHTLGLPDLYDPKTNIPIKEGIMGAGRFLPLHFTYLEPDLLSKMLFY